MGVNVILKRILIGEWERKSPFRRPVLIWGDNIEMGLIISMEFDYPCLRRALNDVLMICVVNCKLHKIREYLEKLSNC
jgi:hypothetical protein